MRNVTLYHYPFSNCSTKVRLALAEKGVEYRARLVDIGPAVEQTEPWYLELNPNGVVPTLEHDGRVITDSAQIIRYIDRVFVGPSLTPADSVEREVMEGWLRRQDNLPVGSLTFGSAPGVLGWGMRKSVSRRKKALEHQKSVSMSLSETYDRKIGTMSDLETQVNSPSAMEGVETQVKAVLDELDLALADNKWIAGTSYSLADVAFTAILARLDFLGRSAWWTEERPNLQRWYTAVRKRASFADAGVVRRLRADVFVPIVMRTGLEPALAVVGLGVLLLALWPAILG